MVSCHVTLYYDLQCVERSCYITPRWDTISSCRVTSFYECIAASYCIVCIVLYCIALFCITSRYTLLMSSWYITSYHIILYNTIIYHILWYIYIYMYYHYLLLFALYSITPRPSSWAPAAARRTGPRGRSSWRRRNTTKQQTM